MAWALDGLDGRAVWTLVGIRFLQMILATSRWPVKENEQLTLVTTLYFTAWINHFENVNMIKHLTAYALVVFSWSFRWHNTSPPCTVCVEQLAIKIWDLAGVCVCWVQWPCEAHTLDASYLWTKFHNECRHKLVWLYWKADPFGPMQLFHFQN